MLLHLPRTATHRSHRGTIKSSMHLCISIFHSPPTGGKPTQLSRISSLAPPSLGLRARLPSIVSTTSLVFLRSGPLLHNPNHIVLRDQPVVSVPAVMTMLVLLLAASCLLRRGCFGILLNLRRRLVGDDFSSGKHLGMFFVDIPFLVLCAGSCPQCDAGWFGTDCCVRFRNWLSWELPAVGLFWGPESKRGLNQPRASQAGESLTQWKCLTQAPKLYWTRPCRPPRLPGRGGTWITISSIIVGSTLAFTWLISSSQPVSVSGHSPVGQGISKRTVYRVASAWSHLDIGITAHGHDTQFLIYVS